MLEEEVVGEFCALCKLLFAYVARMKPIDICYYSGRRAIVLYFHMPFQFALGFEFVGAYKAFAKLIEMGLVRIAAAIGKDDIWNWGDGWCGARNWCEGLMNMLLFDDVIEGAEIMLHYVCQLMDFLEQFESFCKHLLGASNILIGFRGLVLGIPNCLILRQ